MEQLHQFKDFVTLEEFKNDIKNYKLSFIDRIEFLFKDLKNFVYDFLYGIKNIIKFAPIIWKDRWWDYAYFEDLILYKLKDMEKNWGKNTHYIGDGVTKKRLQVLIRKLEEIQKMEENFDEKTFEKRKEFYKLLGNNIIRFWD